MFNSIEEAITDLKNGKVIILVDDEARENEGDFVALSDKVTPEIINFMITHGKGLVCTTISEQLADKLNLEPMTSNNTDPYETAFTVSIDHINTTTGISAFERADTIKALTEESVVATDFKQPGHVFPLIAKAGGVLERQGHTEASIDLAILSDAFPSGTICEIIKENGTMARVPDLQIIAKKFGLTMVTIKDLVAYKSKEKLQVKRETETILPTKYGAFKVYGYSNKIDNKEHIALVKGEIPAGEPTLVRIHSECLTGDVFGSYRCDCGPQLEAAMEIISKEPHGILLYMRQEGRGIGLLNKLRAYELQDAGLDTVEANQQLGFADDLREYGLSARILTDLGVDRVKLLTNNPRKISGLENHQIKIDQRIPLEIASCNENSKYMKTKSTKLGHIFTHNDK